MSHFTETELHDFIVQAKLKAYVGGMSESLSYRPGSHDIQCENGLFQYIDSYFGGTDFIGQEVVYFRKNPVWAMNYYGKILCPDIYTGAKSGKVIKESLARLYQTGKFLGGFNNQTELGRYTDTNEGDVSSFTGYEWIDYQDQKVYELNYHGGLVKN